MSYYEFFKGCLRTTRQKFDKLLNTPRAKGTQYELEKQEIIGKILKCKEYEELTKEEAEQLLREFGSINFLGLSQARKEMKRKRVRRSAR